jgi:hypothetical protein
LARTRAATAFSASCLKFQIASSDLLIEAIASARLKVASVNEGKGTGRINVKSIPNGLKSVWLAGIVLAWLPFASTAAADDITAVSVSVVDDGIGDLPASDLSGWFFSPDPDPPFPAEPDPSQAWTSPENLETMNYWLSLVEELGDDPSNDPSNDPSLLPQLYGLGMIRSPDLTPAQISRLILSNNELISQKTVGDVPEPATLGLLGGGLALLGLYAARARSSNSA